MHLATGMGMSPYYSWSLEPISVHRDPFQFNVAWTEQLSYLTLNIYLQTFTMFFSSLDTSSNELILDPRPAVSHAYVPSQRLANRLP